jgi:hypothetical protein
MKKLFLISLFAASLGLLSYSNLQAQTFKKGDGVFNATIGFGNARYLTGTTSSVPPLAASYEVGVLDNVLEVGSIGIGGYVGYTSAKWDYGYTGYTWGYKSSDIIIGARGIFHYPFMDKLDTYAGLMLAYDINSWKETGTAQTGYATKSSYGGLIVPGFVGARYYFSEKFAGLAELGWGIAYFNIGIALKVK